VTCTGEPNNAQYPSDVIALVVLWLMAAALGSARQKGKGAVDAKRAPSLSSNRIRHTE
jgi:hypothetical protein